MSIWVCYLAYVDRHFTSLFLLQNLKAKQD